MNKFTRRELAAALTTSAVVLAQPAQPQAQPLPANPDEELQAARAQIRNYAEQLDKFPLSMSAEPATTFRP